MDLFNLLYGAEDEDSIPWLAETLVGLKFDACDGNADKRLSAIRKAKNILTEYEDEPSARRTFREGSVIFALMPALKEFIQSEDANVLEDVLDAIHYFIDVGKEERQALIDGGIIKASFSFLDHVEPNVKVAALGVVANVLHKSCEEERELIIGGSIIKTALYCLDHPDLKVKVAALIVLHVFITRSLECLQYALECDVMRSIAECLKHPHKDVHEIALKDLHFYFTCIDDGAACLDDNIMESFIHLFGSGNDAVKSHALICVVRIIKFGKPENIPSIINLNVVQAIFKCLDSDRNGIVGPALTLLNLTLEKCENQVNEFCQMINECGGLDNIKKHQSHADKNVVEAANAFIENFLSAKFSKTASISQSNNP